MDLDASHEQGHQRHKGQFGERKVNQSRIRMLIAPVKARKYTGSFRKPCQLAVFDEDGDGERGDTTPTETPVASPAGRIWSMRALGTLACGFTGTLVVANERIPQKKIVSVTEYRRESSQLWRWGGAFPVCGFGRGQNALIPNHLQP